VHVIDMSEERINIKIVQMVEKFPVIYDYYYYYYYYPYRILGTFDNETGISQDRLTSRALKRTHHVEHTTH
jgi:hypothetical protein